MYKVELSILAVVAGAVAPAHAAPAPMLLPSSLTIAATSGTTTTRLLAIQASETLTSLQMIPMDLSRADGQGTLTAATIHSILPVNEVQAGGILTIPVQFDLQNAPSGEFSGNLLLAYAGGTQPVPITVRIKDFWLFPLVVLVIGVALGIFVSVVNAGVIILKSAGIEFPTASQDGSFRARWSGPSSCRKEPAHAHCGGPFHD